MGASSLLEDANLDSIKEQIAKINWFHSIDLGNGVFTLGREKNMRLLQKSQKLGMPETLSDMTVLDVGAWDGFFSFEAERRGAKRVLATDSYAWQSPEFFARGGTGKAGFELARKLLNSKVEDMNIDVLDLSPENVGRFDLVLFLGVLYHMPHPILALERIASVTKKQLILETHTDLSWTRRPALAFYGEGELVATDPTNWFGPNRNAVISMLKRVGFREVREYASKNSLMYTLAAASYNKLTRNYSFFARLQQNRMVFHAFK
jgi:tRNA (mo5U34)-methyltransferase